MNDDTAHPQTLRMRVPEPLRLDSGASLPGVEIAYRTWGALDTPATNAIIICHAFTGTADADLWWPALFGPGRVCDPQRDFIVCTNVLGGCAGTTGPASPAPDGQRWGSRFPALTIRDQVRAQMRLADALGIRGIRLVIGGSMGGMQALEWAALDPARVQRVASLAACAVHSPWGLAWSEAQRQALAADPRYRDGDPDPADPPVAGLAAARAIGMTTYRTPASFNARFARKRGAEVFGPQGEHPQAYAVNAWLRHHGQALVERFDAHSYRILLDAMDTHDLARDRVSAQAPLDFISQPVLVGSITSDGLYPPAEQQELARRLPHATLFDLDSIHGHDAFLIEAEQVNAQVLTFLHTTEADPGTTSGQERLSSPDTPPATGGGGVRTRERASPESPRENSGASAPA